jgi:hypothetical protein
MTTTTIGSTYETLLDWKSIQKPGGGIDNIIDVLAASNPIIKDAHIMPGNLPTGHQYTQAVTEPTGTWRKLNYGVATSKGTDQQLKDYCGILASYSRIDKDIADLNGNAALYRAKKDQKHVTGLAKTVATAVFYGNQGTDPEQPHGFMPRYNSLTGAFADQIVDAGGTGSNDNTSILIVTWGPETCALIYPPGSTAGLERQDLGLQLVTDSNGLQFTAYVTEFKWKLGLCLLDYRYVIRIANIDVSALTTDASAGADLLDKLVDAYYSRPSDLLDGPMAKSFIYCNKTIAKFLHKQAMNKSNVNLTIDKAGGQPIVDFLGANIRICDAIVSTEDDVD